MDNFTRRAALLGGTWAFAALVSVPALAQGTSKQPIGIIGAGEIGGSVGALWVKAGHPVMFSSRKPDELKDMVAKLGPLAHAGTVAQAIAFSNVLLIAIPYAALPEFGNTYRDALKGKIALDATNAIAKRDGDMAAQALQDGVGVTSQKYLAGTKLVRAFNTLHFTLLTQDANRPAPRVAIPIAGNDPGAIRVAERLIRDAGFDPVLVGKLDTARIFQAHGDPGYGQEVSAAELKQKLNLAP